MIIFRYLAKEILASMFAVSFVLVLIILSARFVRYLAEAAAGKLDAGVLLLLMGLRLPGYLELILPLGLFIGIIMAHGRMYVDSEMTVLSACGVSERRVMLYTLFTSVVVALLVAVFSLFLGPEGVRASESLLEEQRSRTDFETLKPARFHQLNTGKGVSYAESISDDKQRLSHVFMAEVSERSSDDPPTILVAESGETIADMEKGEKYLLLKRGSRYVGRPGSGAYEVIVFDEYAQKLPKPDYSVKSRKRTDGMTTLKLIKEETPEAKAALEWRLSLPLLVLIVGFLAVPLSRTQPRKGRYGKLVPAVLVYMIYLVMANTARGLNESNEAPIVGLLWWVHAGFFALGLIFYNWRSIRGAFRLRRASA